MSFEVELKFPRSPNDGLEARLAAAGFVLAQTRDEADHYLRHPVRDFAKTDEAYRLRQIGARNVVTYKGPKQGAVGKTRVEIEVPLADGEAAAAAFLEISEKNGYGRAATVRKRRRVFRPAAGAARPTGLEATLDEVEEVGSFVELELIAEETAVSAAQTQLVELAERLGLGKEERRSYLELLMAKRAKGEAS